MTYQETYYFLNYSTSCNKTEFGLDYLPFLTPKVTQPLVTKVNDSTLQPHPFFTDVNYSQGTDGVEAVVSTMNYYDLQREDWDSLTELAHFAGQPDIKTKIPSQVILK